MVGKAGLPPLRLFTVYFPHHFLQPHNLSFTTLSLAFTHQRFIFLQSPLRFLAKP